MVRRPFPRHIAILFITELVVIPKQDDSIETRFVHTSCRITSTLGLFKLSIGKFSVWKSPEDYFSIWKVDAERSTYHVIVVSFCIHFSSVFFRRTDCLKRDVHRIYATKQMLAKTREEIFLRVGAMSRNFAENRHFPKA